MIEVGSYVIAYAGTPRAFAGYVIGFMNGARGPVAIVAARPSRHMQPRQAQNFSLHYLTEADAPPLGIDVGAKIQIYGHAAEITGHDSEADTFAALAIVQRESGVESYRLWPQVPTWHLRLGY